MNLNELEKLIRLVEKSEISEIEITRFGHKIRITKNFNSSRVEKCESAGVEVKDNSPKIETKKAEETLKNAVPIKSPIVGTFYRAAAPDAPPYVDVGDIVKPGQVVCIVEAMKLMNEIESEIAGRIVKICIANEEPVEYGQVLFLLEPI